jgi:hypothetical protein
MKSTGITIRDRQRDIVSAEQLEQLERAKILITNYHAFLPREKVAAGKLTKAILANGESSAFTETPDQMVRRVCRELGAKKNIIVINDEAHHCYRRKPDGEEVKLTGDDERPMTESRFVYVTYIRTTPEKLWQALIEPEFTRQYWVATRQEPPRNLRIDRRNSSLARRDVTRRWLPQRTCQNPSIEGERK